MALTSARSAALYQILEVPMGGKVSKLQDENNLTAFQFEATSGNATPLLIEQHIAAMDVGQLAELESLLDKWIDLGTDVIELDGGVGSVQGIKYSSEAERDLIRRRVINAVPFYRHTEEAMNRHRAGRNIFLIR
jgi:hypothetical protein